MYTFRTVTDIINGTILHQADNRPIKNLGLDTRKFNNGDTLLFFAVRGTNNDGHAYLSEAFEKGCRSFVVEDEDVNQWLSHTQIEQSNIIQVQGSIQALQDLAAYHRSLFDIPVIGVTGSNGKTIVKEWLYQLFSPYYKVHRSPRSYNSQIGVPLSVWELSGEFDLAIFEAGISQPGEMKALEKVIQPTSGLFTNIGQAHQAAFDSMQQKVAEKLNLFPNCHELFYCRDYQLITDTIQAKQKDDFFTYPDFTLHAWSEQSKDAELTLQAINTKNQTSKVEGLWKNENLSITIPYADKASIENTVHCWLIGLNRGLNHQAMKEGLKHLSPVEMRLEMKRGVNGSTLINDTYNSDLLSLQIALDLLNQQNQHSKKTVILSDILQSGRDEEALYKEVGAILQSKGVNRLIGIGQALERHQTQIPIDHTIYPTTEAFLQTFSATTFDREAILIKGARKFRFEQITGRLQAKAHQTVLSINLEALINNLNVYRARLNPSTRIMVMVKAFSYGSGTYEVANALQFHKADYLAVAYADEGIALRKAGINVPIMVLNPEQQAFQDFIDYDLEPEIYSLSLLKQFQQFVDTYRPIEAFPVHLKLDTGMHRLGFQEKDLPELLNQLHTNTPIYVASAFSHLAASEAPGEDPFTKGQINLFEQMTETLRASLSYGFMRHILNTSGIIRFPGAHYEMVRLGLGFYGIDMTEQVKSDLQIPASLKTTISQIKALQPGATVGYGRKGRVDKPMAIATIAIGYADGFSRAFSNGNAYVLIRGQRAPVVGDVCMDMTMVDVTGIEAKEGDEVIVFGEEPTIRDLAKWSNTIPYEVLTNISQRVKRVYYNE